MKTFATWLQNSDLTIWMGTNLWVVPLLQVIHIACVAMIFSSSLMIALKVYGFGATDVGVVRVSHRYLPWIWAGMIGLICTGIFQIIAEPLRAMFSWVFQVKLLLALLAVAGTWLFQKRMQNILSAAGQPVSYSFVLRLNVTITLLLWTAVAVLGRLVAYIEVG
jgi:hypothetical protein